MHALLLRLAPAGPADAGPVTILAIDEPAIDLLGSWPWPRATWARLLDRLHEHHTPALVAIDAVFPPAPEQRAGNAAFAAALAAAPASAIGQLMLREEGERGSVRWAELTAPVSAGFPPSAAWRHDGVLGNVAVLANAAGSVGHINARLDADGVMRRVPTLICAQHDEHRCAMSFMQAVASQLAGIARWRVERGGWHQAEWLLVPEGLPELALPTDAALGLVVPWRAPDTLPYVSLADISERRLAPGALDQRVLMVGGVSLGLGDLVISPHHDQVPGVEVHAHTLQAWLDGSLPYQPRYAGPLMFVLAALTALGLAVSAQRLRWLALVTLAGVVVPLGGGIIAWQTGRMIWPAAAPAAFAAVAGTMLMVAQRLRERSRLLHRFAGYLPAPLRRVLDRSDAIVPTETGWGTVMVADILGYTAQSHVLPLNRLAQWCDAGIDHIVRHACEHGAMLDNVAGDGALLLWRAGTDVEQANAAARAARAIVEDLPALNRRLASEGLPKLTIGIGLHAGPYLLGSFGHEHKRYTVVSEVANLAAHIERSTRRQPWPVLLSKTVAQSLPPTATRPAAGLDSGRGRRMPLFTLTELSAHDWPGGNRVPLA